MSTTRDQALDDPDQIIEPVGYDFGVSRRSFVQLLGAGIVIATQSVALAQTPPRGAPESARPRSRRGRGFGRGREVPLEARLHLGVDGSVTVLTGKVEAGQGARAEISSAAAEELRVPPARIRLVMADTRLCPDDGITAGSRTTPSTLPSVRRGCAAARALLAKAASDRWKIPIEQVQIRDGAAHHADRQFTYADLAKDESGEAWKNAPDVDVVVTPVKQWQVLAKPAARPNARDLVTGAHQCPCDISRPGMWYGKVLRPPAYGATLKEIGLGPTDHAPALEGVLGVRDRNFVAVAAPTTQAARAAIETMASAAKWEAPASVSSDQLYEYLRQHADVPANPFVDERKFAPKSLSATYCVPYIQHAPLEPRSAVAEWSDDGKLTVWTSTQNPFGVRRELAGAFHIPESDVRVIVPDFGGAFGGKHTGECAVEAARIAKSAKRPIALHWTRAEEFTWAYFRPAGVIDVAAALDEAGKIASWYFVNINSGPSALETPYRAGKTEQHYVRVEDAPLRPGSYRALAATANTFARESFMDELAQAAGQDPLAFRLANLENPRLRDVLETAAQRFGWSDRIATKRDPDVGIGLACGTDKGDFVAACTEVRVDRGKGTVSVRKVCQVFDCGAICNPSNLHSQVQAAIIMGIGPALREAIHFDHGKVTNASFSEYEVPRFSDVPPVIDVHLLDRPDIPSAGAGEIPLIAIAPAMNNAIFDATGKRLRELPLRL